MRVLIVAVTDHLPAFLSAMNPATEVCAFVVDESEPAQAIANKFNRGGVPIFPYWHLKESLESFYFDYVINATRVQLCGTVIKELQNYDVTSDKMLSLVDLDVPTHIDSFTKLMTHYKNTAERYNIFATGISYIHNAIEINQFELPTLNFARGGQDLYYDFKIAKEVINTGGGRKNLRYALIGLAPYSFSYDASRVVMESWRLLQWFLYFRDLHNYHMSAENYASLFRKEYLDGGYVTPAPIELGNVYMNKAFNKTSAQTRFEYRQSAETWSKKYYPKTVAENKQILHDYLTLCEEHEIKPILFLPAMPRGYMETYPRNRLDEFHTILREIMSRHSTAVFFDGWQIRGLTDDDFADTTHLNVMGGAKFSHLLNRFVMQFERNGA